MKETAGLTGQPALVLGLAAEFRAIDIGEFFRQPVEAREVCSPRCIEEVLMGRSLLEALHETYLVRMEHTTTPGMIYMIINSEN